MQNQRERVICFLSVWVMLTTLTIDHGHRKRCDGWCQVDVIEDMSDSVSRTLLISSIKFWKKQNKNKMSLTGKMCLGWEQYHRSWPALWFVTIAMWADSGNVNGDEQTTHPLWLISQCRGNCGGWFQCWSLDITLFHSPCLSASCWRVVVVVAGEILPHSVMHWMG